MGTVLLQQAFDLSNEEDIEQLAFNEQWYFAFNITGEKDDDKYLSLKSLYNTQKNKHGQRDRRGDIRDGCGQMR